MHFDDNRAWRIPLWIQMSFSGVIAMSVFFLPESPRWLMANDRHEEALAVCAHQSYVFPETFMLIRS